MLLPQIKIGILGCFYGKEEYIDECLSPWFQFKKENKQTIISVSNFEFAENVIDESKFDTKVFESLKKITEIDFLYSECEMGKAIGQKEATIRNVALLPLLESGVDFVWLLDLDEFYTLKDIYSIIEFVNIHKSYVYEINFKNYIFEGKSYIEGFHPPRIFLNDGISEFYWDNDISYGGQSYKEKGVIEIPKEIAFIKHLTWLNKDGNSKVEYQMKHFGNCSYKWNAEKQSLEFNEEYFRKTNEKIPEVFKDEN